jgi:CheY-like chemotaxis protein
MSLPKYQLAEALIYDPVASNRSSTVASLFALGFRDVAAASSMEALTSRVERSAPDVLLCEISGAEMQTRAFIQNLRQGKIGKNPFVVVLATTWRRDGIVMQQALNAGADDVIERPMATPGLAERLEAQHETRKPFVVTADYVGPDRRRDPARSGGSCVAVPNPLSVKAAPGIAREDATRLLHGAVKEAASAFNLEKMRRNAVQLCGQWRLLDRCRPGGQDFGDLLTRMRALNEDIARRATGSPQAVALAWCVSVTESIAAIAQMIDKTKNGSAHTVDVGAPMRILGQTTLSLGKFFAAGELPPSHLIKFDPLASRLLPGAALRLPPGEKLRSTA